MDTSGLSERILALERKYERLLDDYRAAMRQIIRQEQDITALRAGGK